MVCYLFSSAKQFTSNMPDCLIFNSRESVESTCNDEEKQLMKQLEKRLSTPSVGKDDEALYGELLASNLRKLDKDNQLLA